MSDKPETLDAVLGMEYNGAEGHEEDTVASIVAEMRETWTDTPPCILSDLADRIEAAAKRERNAHMNDIHNALYMATGIPGNAAALSEALVKLTDAVRNYFGWDDAPAVQDRDDPTAYFCAEMSAALAALAAPARNCDRFATAEDAYAAWQKHNSLTAICDWLFAPAEGGDHA